MQAKVTIAAGALALGIMLARGATVEAEEDETVPTTVEGGAATIKEGGRDIGEGFKGIGRGIRDVFTGESSKENFREGAKIGTGVVDVGRGIGGVGRGTGRGIRDGFKREDADSSKPSASIQEENLEQ